MIAKLSGTIEYLRGGSVVVDVNGVGYRVFVTAHTFGTLAGRDAVSLYTHTHVREDILALYGFLTLEELEMFELLISISGVGPKAALGILSIADPNAVKAAVLNEDPSILTRVSGVGKKTAERVILELGGKIAKMPALDQERAVADSEAIEALNSLGYSVGEAREILKKVPADVQDVGERVKKALQFLGKK